MTGYSERLWQSRDGLSFFARDYPGESGAAKLPVVCLHGLTRNSGDFGGLAPAIAQSGRRVIVPDVRGRGRSAWDPNPGNYIPQIYARDVLELLDALGVSRAVFVGTSMGGIIMMMLAIRHRQRVAAAVLNDVGPVVSPEGLARIKSYAGQPLDVKSWSDAVAYVRGINQAALPYLNDAEWEEFTERTFEKADEGPRLKYDPAIAVPLQKGKAKAPSLIAWFLYRRLAKGRPVLIVRGANSDILSHATAMKMTTVTTKARLVEIPGVGHAPTLDEPVAAEAMMSFLDRVD